MRRAGFTPWMSLLFILPVYFDFRLLFFNAVRPQLFSFLFTALLFYVIEARSGSRKRKYILLFPLLVVWGNLHPAVLFGFLVLCIYSFSALIRNWGAKKGFEEPLCYLLASTGAFCNPNTWQVLRPLLMPFDSSKSTALYYSNHPDGMTILQLWDLGLFVFWGGAFAFFIGLIVVLSQRRNVGIEHLLVFVLVICLAVFKGRFLIFLTISTMVSSVPSTLCCFGVVPHLISATGVSLGFPYLIS